MKGVLLPVAGMVLLACGSAWADSKTVNLRFVYWWMHRRPVR